MMSPLKLKNLFAFTLIACCLVSCTRKEPPAVVQRHENNYYGPKGIVHLVQVRSDDTLKLLAQRYGASTKTIARVNNLIDPSHIFAGQILKIPTNRFHKVADGETLSDISVSYGTSMAELKEINDITDSDSIVVGQLIEIPSKSYKIDYNDLLVEKENSATISSPTSAEGSANYDAYNDIGRQELVSKPKTHSTTSRPKETPTSGKGKQTATKPQAKVTSKPKPANLRKTFRSATPLARPKFMWPLKGEIIMRYGKHGNKFNEGINISAPAGTIIKAAADGRAIYVGNELEGYGELIILQHSGDVLTAYAHNQKNLIRMGEKVKKGQVIAKVGKSGNVSRPQLHFSIRKGKSTVDPELKS